MVIYDMSIDQHPIENRTIKCVYLSLEGRDGVAEDEIIDS